MISEIKLEGFKSFMDGSLILKPFTLLAGLNSSGKSSVIQALLMACRGLKYGNFLLDDHGTVKELTNIYATEFNIKLINDKGEIVILHGKDDTQEIDSSGFSCPELFYSEAGRYGSQNSIKVFNNTVEMDSKGGNLLKCIDTYADMPIPMNLRHPESQGETFMFNLQAWLDIISPGINFTYVLQKLSDQSFSFFDEHRATNVGFGLSYALPVLAVLLRASLRKDSLVLLENPEAHLFDGIRLYTKQHEGFETKFISYWFELNKNKNTEIESITLDSNGKMTGVTPKGFFDQFELDAINLF